VGRGVQDALEQMFHKYNLQAKTWAALTKSEPVGHAAMMPAAWAASPDTLRSGLVPAGDVKTFEEKPAGLLDRGALRYQILVPSYTVMFAFFLVLTVGWLFVAERRQGTMLRLRAAPLTRGQILVGKLIPCYSVSLVQGVFLLAAGWLIFGMKW